MTQVEYVGIDASREGQRLDNFLVARLKGVPKSVIYRILRTGQVRVNKGRVKPGYKLRAGDEVRIPPLSIAAPDTVLENDAQRVAQMVGAAILYENEDFMVINKPSGLAVHGGSGLRYGLIEALHACPPYANVELVHRLDRGTSGCLLLAKHRSALRELHELLRKHEIDKTYLALVSGRFSAGSLTVDAPLDRGRLKGGERMAVVSDTGKAAYTSIRVVEHFPQAQASLVEVRIDTGRTHQIRVHCAAQGHPLAGDDKYGDRDFNRRMRKLGLHRIFLHAARLRFDRGGRPFEITAPLNSELSNIINALK
ncbi:MAG TPA: RluA family pseudouridine synthase [Gammaproteobacteria bacterium]|jgi:23S rRNA pseudouridine955/2504/2580 synthase